MNTNNKLAGKNVLITAGAQGIGKSITRHFIDSGANVAIHYFSSAHTANELVEYATSKGAKTMQVFASILEGRMKEQKLDLSKKIEIQGMHGKALE